MAAAHSIELTAIIRMCDDEEQIGHVVRRVASHLRSLRTTFELLAVDEGSGDNTLFVANLLKRDVPELEVEHARAGHGFRMAAEQAHGRFVLCYDARAAAPLGALGYALSRLREDLDLVSVGGRYLVMRRARAWRAFDALASDRDMRLLERVMLRRCRGLGLECAVTHAAPSTLMRIGQTLGLPRFVEPAL